jgi:hypothetical protein
MKGRIPGEGAAGVLVRRRIDPKAESHDSASMYVHRAVLGRRTKSADEGRAAGGQLLPELAQQAASAANVPIENIAAMIADTDHRAHRFMEVVQASNSLAKIKKDEDFSAWSTGQSMGYAGAAATLAALSACKEYAAEEKKPVLWCSAQDDFERAVVVVSAMNF